MSDMDYLMPCFDDAEVVRAAGHDAPAGNRCEERTLRGRCPTLYGILFPSHAAAS